MRVIAWIVVGVFACSTLPLVAQSLVDAAKSGDVKSVQKVLTTEKKAPNVNEQDQEGLTALMIASVAGDSAMVAALLDAHANPNIKANNGMTALLGAVFNARAVIVPMLIAAKADVNVFDRKARTPLMIAAEKGVNDPVSALCDAGASLEVKNSKGCSPLMIACGNRHLNVMMELLEKGANPNTRDLQGRTPAMLLCFLGEDEMLKLLIHHKPDLTLMDYVGKTALEYAKEYKRRLCIEVLTQAGATR